MCFCCHYCWLPPMSRTCCVSDAVQEACAFRDEYSRFTDMGAAVFGISSDSPEENAAWAKANNLPFPLLTDSNSILRKSFGIKADFLGLLPGRQTY
eukprot:scaffold238108_cov15-Tisochrysis_lutea.AAC.3